MTTSLIMAGGYRMLIRSTALAMALFIPTNLPNEAKVERENVTAIYYDAAPVTWLTPKMPERVPVVEPPQVMAEMINPEAKPAAKPVVEINTIKRKCWRDRKGGRKTYRLRLVCRAGERAKP